MAKIATLHNGVQIHFPDETPDAEMDKAVQNHLGIGEPRPDMMGVLLEAISKHTAALAAAKKEPKDDTAQKALLNAISAHVTALGDPQRISILPEEGVDHRHGENIQMMASHLQGLHDSANASREGFSALLPVLKDIAKNTQHAEELVISVRQLATVVLEVGKIISNLLRAPKEFSFDSAGKPKGISIKGQ